jgi:site-specific DNA-methyltransferase (cytosine-N4-specific)
MEPYYADESVTLFHGDALKVLREMPDASVDCCVTSPPYFGLRDYGVDGQYGLEASPAEYVETMRALFAEVRRVLTDDGTLWLNIGDSYSGGGGGAGGKAGAYIAGGTPRRNGADHYARIGVGPKNLLGIPWRTAFALQDDGWILRNDIIWSKPNAMPESVTDRLSSRHEHLFMLTKSRRYWFDLDPIREEHEYAVPGRKGPGGGWADDQSRGTPATGKRTLNGNIGGKNPGDVWTIATQPFAEAHFAVMPQALAERAILAGCKPGGTVLDPFSGSGTTGLAATKHGRKYVGIDLSADYLDLSLRTRLAQGVLDFGDGGAA